MENLSYLLIKLGILAFFGMIFSFPVMLLWNLALIPAIPGIMTISWTQAWGIMILCELLFKSPIKISNSSKE